MPPANRNNLGGIKKPSSPSDFKKKREPVELPSGNSMVLKPTSVAGFLQSGTLPNSLLGIVQQAMSDKTGKKADAAVADLVKEPDKMKDLFDAVDLFVCSVALEPRVYPTPDDEALRDDQMLYVDELDLEDKLFIFTQAVGGNGGVEPFRPQPAGGVGGVQPRKAVGSATKRTPRGKA
jgi:hypothetical protein